jgi:serine/threonine-protein kinase
MTRLTPERRDEIETLFEAALDLPATARAEWLSERCRDDAELRDEVAALLSGHERTGGILEADAVGLASALVPDAARDRRIGPFRVHRELGRGGMGVVYLAERDDGHFRQRVALKLLRDTGDAEELRHRFLAERQILASLNHPNIAQLLDGGVTDGQLPYLAMEYVEGTPITAFCDRQRLTVDARLRLFRDVCAAVHHAHQNLVIHRDIKPGNILVTADGRVKLLDFGIAKLLNSTLGVAPLPVTHTAFRVMTPEYASPEQVRGESLTTASDVYALGIVLYELLSGRRPYRLTSGAPHELARAVCEQEPVRPSVRVTQPATGAADAPTEPVPSADAVAAARGTSVDRLARRLRGDLDAIVAMALRKEAAHRYGSAELFWQDIQRHLDELPVLAHRGSRGYRARKFLGRHRREAAAAALVLVAVVGGAGVAVRQAVSARRERDRAEQARVQAESMTSFLVGLFDATNRQPHATAITADDLVRRGATQAEALAGSPLTQARMLETIGRVYASMGRYAASRAALERSLTVRTAQIRGDDAEGAVTMYHLAEALRQLGRYREAEAISRRALVVRVRAFGEEHPAVAELLAQQAGLAVYLARDSVAEVLSRRALEIRRRTLDPGDAALGASLHQYAIMLHRNGNPGEAEAILRQGIATQRLGGSAARADVANLELRLAGVLLEARGDSVAAEVLARSALSSLRAALGDNHVAVGLAMGELAGYLSRRGEYAEAERLMRESLRIHVDALGVEHPGAAAATSALGTVLSRAGRHVEAERLQYDALQTLERVFGQNHPSYAGALAGWGDKLAALGRIDEAIAAHERALYLRREALVGTTLLAISKANLADLYARRGDYATADSLFGEALALQLARRPESHFDVRRQYRQMASRYAREGKTAEAERYRQLSLPR